MLEGLHAQVHPATEIYRPRTSEAVTSLMEDSLFMLHPGRKCPANDKQPTSFQSDSQAVPPYYRKMLYKGYRPLVDPPLHMHKKNSTAAKTPPHMYGSDIEQPFWNAVCVPACKRCQAEQNYMIHITMNISHTKTSKQCINKPIQNVSMNLPKMA